MPLCQACAMDMCDGDRRQRFWDCVVARALRENMTMGAEPESGDAGDCMFLVLPDDVDSPPPSP